MLTLCFVLSLSSQAEALDWLHERENVELEQARQLATAKPNAIKLSEAVFHKMCNEVCVFSSEDGTRLRSPPLMSSALSSSRSTT